MGLYQNYSLDVIGLTSKSCDCLISIGPSQRTAPISPILAGNIIEMLPIFCAID